MEAYSSRCGLKRAARWLLRGQFIFHIAMPIAVCPPG